MLIEMLITLRKIVAFSSNFQPCLGISLLAHSNSLPCSLVVRSFTEKFVHFSRTPSIHGFSSTQSNITGGCNKLH